MLKRNPECSPQEKRARRVRAAFLATSATLLVLLLLATAWVGGVLRRSQPATTLELAAPAAAQLTFSLERAVADAARLEGGQSAASDVRRQFALLRQGFHPTAEVYYLRPDGDGEPRWIAYLPLRRKNRVFRDSLAKTLAALDQVVLPMDTEPVGEQSPQARYLLKREGLLLFSGSGMAVPSVNRRASSETSGYVLTGSAAALPVALAEALGATSGTLTATWLTDEVEVRIEGEASARKVPWFHPFLPGRGQEDADVGADGR